MKIPESVLKKCFTYLDSGHIVRAQALNWNFYLNIVPTLMTDSSLLIVKNLTQLAKRCQIAQPRRLCGDFNPVSHLQSLSDSYFLVCYNDGAQAYVYTSHQSWSLIDVLDLNEESGDLDV